MKIKGFDLSFKPLGYVESNLGKLAVFDISYGDNNKVREQLGHSFKTPTPKEFIRTLLPYIAHRAGTLGDDNKKPNLPTLTEHEIDELTPQQIDNVLEHFIHNQGHLYRKPQLNTTTDESGKPVALSGDGEIVHPRHEGESNTDYLHRLYVLREERDRAAAEQMMSRIIDRAHFSNDLTNHIKSTLLIGEELSKAIKSIQLPKIDSSAAKALRDAQAAISSAQRHVPKVDESVLKAIEEAQPAIPSVKVQVGPDDISEGPSVCPEPQHNDDDETESNRGAPSAELGDRLDRLIEINQESLSFAIKSNEGQTRMAAEIKSSGEETSRIGKSSLNWTKVVVGITLVGFVLPMIIRWAFDDAAPILTELKNGRQTQTRQNDRIVAALSELIELQSQQQSSDRETIEALRQQITDLQDQIHSIKSENNENEKAEE